MIMDPESYMPAESYMKEKFSSQDEITYNFTHINHANQGETVVLLIFQPLETLADRH